MGGLIIMAISSYSLSVRLCLSACLRESQRNGLRNHKTLIYRLIHRNTLRAFVAKTIRELVFFHAENSKKIG